MSAILLFPGCGSGSGGGVITNCDIDAFTPNYARQLNHLLNWSSFPLTVFFVRDANHSTARQNLAIAGFDQWVAATNGVLDYSVVNDESSADLVVRFDPTTANGATTIHFSGLTLSSAEMELGVLNQTAADLQCVAAHEFGHALGIDGHSDDEDDLLYPIHFVGSVCPITQRDLNTIRTGYCHLFGRAAACCSSPAVAKGPLQSKRIE
jgi:predicted Zn-dependent protease